MFSRRADRFKSRGPSPSSASGAFAWSLMNTLVSRLGTLGIGIILARVLGPEQFGTFAIALVALMAVLSFNELGVSLAIVRWPGDPALIAPTVNTISLVGSALFCAVSWFAAPAFTSAMGDPEATGVVRLLIMSVLVNGAVASPAALLQRAFLEKTRMGIDQVNVWVGAIVSVALALMGMGAMALAIGRVLGSVISALLFIRASPLPYRLGWRREKVKPLLNFGLPLAGSSIIVFTIGYSDQLIAGSLIGTVALGYYVLAFNLSSWPVSIVSQPLRRVAPAAFAAIQGDPIRLRAAILGLFSVLGCATIPAFSALAGASVPLVRFVYGDIWLPAAAALSWLVISALAKVFCELAYDYIVVIGRTGKVLMIQIVGLLVLIPALVGGSIWGGLVGIAAAQAAVSFLVLLPMYLWQLRGAGIGITDVLGKLWLPGLAGVAVGCLAWLAATNVHHVFWALTLGGVAALTGMAVLVYLRRGDVLAIRGIVRAEAAAAIA
ncbi:hypothetical protein FM101_13695 [Arthrobacter rhombi]|uniref:Polysaccharide biosynthesis protein n=2 Tax=Arthrobacter rhombi TaxID=71253 RepID=A0A1R4GTS9_9MICC|nr:hypothetical protein FM101_13695 [Arthrobacter rhombi]